MIVIGMTGKNCSGKGEVAKFLTERSFTYFSLSDIIRDELKKLNLPDTRDNLVTTGNRLRNQHGSAYLAVEVVRRLSPDNNYIIDSIRNPSEIESFRKECKHFVLINVDAAPETRFERMKTRRRGGDPETFEDFIRVEREESKREEEHYQQLEKCAEMADVRIENHGDIPELHEKLTEWISTVLGQDTRPDWDSYFMQIARTVAVRSNCMKRQIAALIVRDNRVIATGYNGTPIGLRNCIEGGCPRCASLAKSGTRLSECLCSHAEENAITQSARYGISVEGSVIYTTFSPCLICSKMIINSGIKEVIYNHKYPMDDVATRILTEASVLIRKWN